MADQKICFLKFRFFEKVTEHFVPKFDSHLAQTDTFRRFRAFGGCVAAKIPRNFFEQIFSSEDASNVCSGPGCLVSDISRKKNRHRFAKIINLNTFGGNPLGRAVRRSAGFRDFPEIRPSLRTSISELKRS